MKGVPILFGFVIIAGFLSIGILVTPKDDALLGRYETGDMKFEKLEIGDKIVYWHQRTIDGAIVEGDFILLQFDKTTKELLKREVLWRDDLPEHSNLTISEEQAESIVNGQNVSAELYIISPESEVFPIISPPKYPCWVVRSSENRKITITIIDAVTGDILGYGIPPPPDSISPGSNPSEPSVSTKSQDSISSGNAPSESSIRSKPSETTISTISGTPTTSLENNRIPGFELMGAIIGCSIIVYIRQLLKKT